MRETTGRNAPQVKEVEKYAAEHAADLRAIELDVSSQQSSNAAIQEIVSKNGRLDVVVHALACFRPFLASKRRA
jgi:NAD(P)-dependent dehydrogenase (short-subunit alcohol dehydrogenase family)